MAVDRLAERAGAAAFVRHLFRDLVQRLLRAEGAGDGPQRRFVRSVEPIPGEPRRRERLAQIGTGDVEIGRTPLLFRLRGCVRSRSSGVEIGRTPLLFRLRGCVRSRSSGVEIGRTLLFFRLRGCVRSRSSGVEIGRTPLPFRVAVPVPVPVPGAGAGAGASLAHPLGDQRERAPPLAHRVLGPCRGGFEPETLEPAPRPDAPPRTILSGPQQERHRPAGRDEQHEKDGMHHERQHQDHETGDEQRLFRGPPARRPRVLAVRVEPRAERVVPGPQAFEQLVGRTGAGVGGRETRGGPGFEPAQPIESLHDRIGVRARHLHRTRPRPGRSQRHAGHDPLDLQVGTPGAQGAQPFLVPAKPRDLRPSDGRTRGLSVHRSLAAHRPADARRDGDAGATFTPRRPPRPGSGPRPPHAAR